MPIYRIAKPPNTKNLAREIALKAKTNWLRQVVRASGSLTIRELKAYKIMLKKSEEKLAQELGKKLKI